MKGKNEAQGLEQQAQGQAQQVQEQPCPLWGTKKKPAPMLCQEYDQRGIRCPHHLEGLEGETGPHFCRLLTPEHKRKMEQYHREVERGTMNDREARELQEARLQRYIRRLGISPGQANVLPGGFKDPALKRP